MERLPLEFTLALQFHHVPTDVFIKGKYFVVITAVLPCKLKHLHATTPRQDITTDSSRMEFNMQSHEDEDAPISAPNPMQDGPVDSQPELPYNQEQVMTTHVQNDEAGYQQLGFMTSRGQKWFTLSPDTLVECLIDSEMYLLRSAPTDEIDFDAVLSMAAFDIDSEQTTSAPFHGKSLLEIVDEAVEEGVRQRSMIRRVITEMLACRHGVTQSVLDEAEKLLDDEIYERGISVFEQWKPASLPLKVRHHLLSSEISPTDGYRHVS